MSSSEKIALMKHMFAAAVEAANPENFMADAVRQILQTPYEGKIFVTGFGKASAVMAHAFEAALPKAQQDRLEGMVIVPDGHGVSCQTIKIIEASHPVPDSRGLNAASQIMERAQKLQETDLMIVLISGGGSSLFCVPHPDLGFSEKQDITTQLLRNGAPIDAMNCVRKHLSAGKGGRLAVAAYPASTISLAISDVPGDDPCVIASGPTCADPTTATQALDILNRYDIQVSDRVLSLLNSPNCETPFAKDIGLSKSEMHILATPLKSLQAAAEIARMAGYNPVILGDSLEGESRILAAEMAEIARNSPEKTALISGGETTVIVKGSGTGGRNVEFIHALALEGYFYGLAADTDGIDGGAPVAGAYITPESCVKASALGLDPRAYLENNDSHSFFAAIDSQIITGPTKTNVNDFRVILT